MAKTIVYFDAVISRQADRLVINIPKSMYPMVADAIGKKVRVEIKELATEK